MITKLYTKNNCAYCDVMKNKLNSWGIKYDVLNVHEDCDAFNYLVDRGIKSVPQVFVNDFHVNKNISSVDFTEMDLYNGLDDLLEEMTHEDIKELLNRT